MFSLHQRSRRTICRVAFSVFCAIPTLLVVCWILWLHTPAHVRSVARQISMQLGVDVSIDEVRHPRPGATIYRGVVLTDRETGARILATDEARTARGGGTLLVTAARLELYEARLDLLWQTLAGRLRTWQEGSARLAVGQVALGSTTVSRLRARLEATRDRAQSLVTFCLPDSDEESPVQVHVLRNRPEPLTTQVELRTGSTSLPCSLARPLLPGLAHLGDDAGFRGMAWVNLQRDGWTGQILASELTGVDFERLVSNRYPCRLSGMARILIEQAHLRDGRVTAAAGSVSIGPGLISRTLCQAAVEGFHLAAVDLMVVNSQLIPYQELACGFAVDQYGLQLRGGCREGPPGTILTTTTGPLLAVTHGDRLPTVALVRTLVPRRDLLVPATPAAEALTRALPQAASPSRSRDSQSAAARDVAPHR